MKKEKVQPKSRLQTALVIGGCFVILLGLFYLAGKNPIQEASITLASLTNRQAILRTTKGDITIQFLPTEAPRAVLNFVSLAKKGFYDGTKFHRVIRNFMVQGGDPLTKDANTKVYGRGGPGYTFGDEISNEKMVRGVVAMANSGPNTNGSQFFILEAAEAPWLQGKHTIFAKVIDGMDVVDAIASVQTQNLLPVKPIVLEQVILR